MGKPKNPGPEPDRLKIERDDWKEAVREALQKERPPKGWPKPGKKLKKKRKNR